MAPIVRDYLAEIRPVRFEPERRKNAFDEECTGMCGM